MDERHWWFASKLQETFHFGGYDNPTLLEDFLSEPDVVSHINSFLSPGEPHKLFFYCDAIPNTYATSPGPAGENRAPSATSRQLHITSKLSTDVVSQNRVCLYILRKDTGGEVDISQMEKELYCGELRHSVLSSLASLLSEAYMPLLNTQRNWGDCSDESVTHFLQNFEKFSNALLETAAQAQIHQPLLQRPSFDMKSELMPPNQYATTATSKWGMQLVDILVQYEGLVADWVSTIESLLLETTDERLEDPNSSPLAELTKWQRRQTLLCSVVEQLKTKECKAVLAALVATKSKLLKKWKSIDLQLTDAFNNARDRVRYLEALSPHLEALEATPPPPLGTVVSNILPALVGTIKQMEGLSKSYARSGYLGILFTKICNSVVKVCMTSLESYVTSDFKHHDHFWILVSEAILSEARAPATAENKNHPLISKLNVCLQLGSAFKELLYHLRDVLLTPAHANLLASNLTSVNIHGPSLGRNTSTHSTSSSMTTKKPSISTHKRHQSLLSNSSASDSNNVPNTPLGIPLQNVDRITTQMNDFSGRVLRVLEIVSTLAQFEQMNVEKKLESLPRIAGLWDLNIPSQDYEDERDVECLSVDSGSRKEGGELSPEMQQEKADAKSGIGSSSDITIATPDFLEQLMVKQSHHRVRPLATLKEESLASNSLISSKVATPKAGTGALNSQATNSMVSSTTTTSDESTTSQGNRKHSNAANDSIALMIQVRVKTIQDRLQAACSQGVVDVFSTTGRNKATFMSAYDEYTHQISQLEENVCLYLKSVFAEIATSTRALDIVSRFNAVSSRVALKEAFRKCMLTALSRYSLELEEIQALYKRDKGSPPALRNAPPVAAAVSWSRQLLLRVEEPMKVFRTNDTIMQSMEFVHVCKLYNRLATLLLKYETLWLSQWRGAVDRTKSGLKAPLLVQQEAGDGTTPVIKVNSSKQLFVLIAESKALTQLGVAIPETAKNILVQEPRVKQFRQQLECVLEEFYTIQESLDPPIRPLMLPHIESVIRSLLPGWTTLSWSTMNIDAFLHRVQTSVTVLKELADKVGSLLKEKVYGKLEEISKTLLFDQTLATSKAWDPQEFSDTILPSVFKHSNKLLDKIAIICTTLVTIIALTNSASSSAQQQADLLLLSSTTPKEKHPAESSLTSSERRGTLHSISSKGTPHRDSPFRFQSTQHTPAGAATRSGTMMRLTTPTHSLGGVTSNLEPAEEDVLNHFCQLVFDAVSKTVFHSHDRFSNSLYSIQYRALSSTSSRKGGNVGKEKAVSFDVPALPDEHDTASVQSKTSPQKVSSSPSTRSSCPSPPLKLNVEVHFSTPQIQLVPSLDEVHSHLMDVSSAISEVLRHVRWWVGPNAGLSLYESFEVNGAITSMQESILQALQVASPALEDHLQPLKQFDFLWQQDLHTSYQHFLDTLPQQTECSSHVENFMQVEEKIGQLQDVFVVGPLQISTRPVKNSFQSLSVAWKYEFASFLHEQAKSTLQSLVSQREAMIAQLKSPVETLVQLKTTLDLLHNITDLQLVIDDMYLPIEQLYELLRQYNPHLARSEIQQVDSLRDEWNNLTVLAEEVQKKLLSEQRPFYERDVDKQVKAFVVETIQFRNSFDTEGPLVPGLLPSEAVERLGSFLEQFEELKIQRDLLAAVQHLLDIPPTPYPELDQTEQDLLYLGTLYSNYQHFLTFDKKLRQQLWAEVDLDSAMEEVAGFWSAYESLPLEQQEWDASRKLRSETEHYAKILPLLKQLHSKEIRNRHWLKVMSVANCTFQLEGSVFKMAHLLDASLLLHAPAIQDIVHSARCELELEEQFYAIEEEWTEQVFQFLPYKSHGHILLNIDHTHSLLEQLEHAQMQLATMLMSKYIQPLKEEAAQWAVKLSNISDILQQWLQVQELWQNLEAVFNTPLTAREFPEEVVKFASIHKQWVKLMKKAYETRNVLQCCIGGDIPKSVLLSKIGRELESCKKSLTSYLLSKRQVFPRFYFVSDDSLLSILSNPTSVSSIQSHLGSLFGAVTSLVVSREEEIPEITGVKSTEGEILQFNQPVPLSSGVEQWVNQVLSTSRSTLHHFLESAVELKEGSSFSLEECAHSNVTQVAFMALFFQWTRDTEHALSQCRYDRRALPGARNRFNNWAVGKVVNLLMRNSWRVADETLTGVDRAKLESLAMLSLWLRDSSEDLCRRKLRDVSDFEWQRFMRPYLTPNVATMGDGSSEGSSSVVLECLDQRLQYGFEYLGCSAPPVFTPRSDNYIVAFTQALSSHLGSMLIGPSGSGKVQLIKGIAQICGRFVSTFHCCGLTDKIAIAKTFDGLAQDGCWVCFSDAHTLPASSLSVLTQMMQVITLTLQAKKTSCQLPCGREVTLQPQLGVFLTHTSSLIPRAAAEWQLPSTLSPLFRTFSIAIPDPTIVFHVHCTALGLKGTKVLSSKLAALQSMAKEQLSQNCTQASLSTYTLCNVLKVASRKLISSKVTQVAEGKGMAKKNVHFSKQTADHSSELRVFSNSSLSPAHEVMKSRIKSSANLNVPQSSGQHQLSSLALKEHSLIAQLILNIAGPRFPEKELHVFTSIVKELFSGCPDVASMQVQSVMVDVLSSALPVSPTASIKFTTNATDLNTISELLREQAEKGGLVPSESWMSKTEQLFTLTQLNHAVIIAGEAASGKSAALGTVVSALNAVRGVDGQAASNVKLMKMFPDTFEDISDLFGRNVSPGGDWIDGIFTNTFRKAQMATQTVTWECLDGSLHPIWMDYLTELIGKSKTLTLSNGEHLFLKVRNLKLIFETGSLQEASPASLLSCGIVYFDSGVLGWKPVVQTWLDTRTPQESQCLHKYFHQLMDPIVEYVLQKAGQHMVYSEVGLLETCLAYLSTLLNIYSETAEVFNEVHVERLLLFSIIWSYGGVLVREKEQKKFSQLLKTLTNSLPDDDTEFSVFDYYVDESGEWDLWQSRIPEEVSPQVDMLGSVYVDTTDTVRVEVLLELALMAKRHVLLAGPHGCGKTTICKHFLQSRVLSAGCSEVLKQVVFNGYSDSNSLHNFMQVNFHHRQGYTYGPKHGKTLLWSLDDLHLPLRRGQHPVCSSHEYLRQLADGGGLYNLEKKNEWCLVEDLVLFASLSTNSSARVGQRLQRHFAVVHVPSLTGHNLEEVVSQQFYSLANSHTAKTDAESCKQLLEASIEVYSSVIHALNNSDMPGRQHYFFSLGHLESVFQGLCHCDTVGCELGYLWSHEMKRSFTSGLCRVSDNEWLQGYIDSISQRFFTPADEESTPASPTPVALSAISTEVKQGKEQLSSIVSPVHVLPEVRLQPLNKWSDLHIAISHHLRRYQEEHGESHSLELSDNNISYLIKLHRALKLTRGNSILVGSLGQPLECLAHFSLYIAGYEVQPLDVSKKTAFTDSLRSLFRQTGLEGKPVAVVINEKHLAHMSVLSALNNLMACGELVSLFSNDEMEGLLQALAPSIKRDFPSEETDPMQYFTARIYRNLRIVICLPPTSPLLNEQTHDFKGILQSSHIIWMCDWTSNSLKSTTHYFFDNSPLSVKVEDHLRTPLHSCLSAVHCHFMQETGQLIQAGLQPTHLEQEQQQVSEHLTQLGSTVHIPSSTDPPPSHDETPHPQDSPSSAFNNLMEKVLRLDRSLHANHHSVELELPYIGLRTYLQFMECFCELYRKKNSEMVKERKNLSCALETLHGTQREAEEMKNTLKKLKQQYEKASQQSENLLHQLTAKSCQLERLRAILGQGSSVLSAMQMVAEQERLLLENEEDDEELLAVFVDRRSSRLEALLLKAKEQLSLAEEEENEAKQAMLKAKKDAKYWHNKIDRNTIDQIKSLNNPPHLVGTIMELILTLLRQYGGAAAESQSGSEEGSATAVHNPTPQHAKKRSSFISASSEAAETAKMEKEQWNGIQIAIGDSQKFLDLLNGLKWEEGLSPAAVNLIKSKLAIEDTYNSRSSESLRRSVSTEGSLVDAAGHLITVSMARHAAESAASMCAFAVSIVMFNDSLEPYKLAHESLKRAQDEFRKLEVSLQVDSSGQTDQPHKSEPPELEDVPEESEMGEEDVVRLEEELSELQEGFDKAVIEKHSLEQTCQQLAEKLKSANHLLESLKTRQTTWQNRLDLLPESNMLLANCILGAAFTVYCGPLKSSARQKVHHSLVSICKSSGFPAAGQDSNNLLTPSSYPKFMVGEPCLYHFVMEGLSSDLSTQQNACIITHSHPRVWPLILDPLGMVEGWLKKRETDTLVIKYSNEELHTTLLKSMYKGGTMIITEVNTVGLADDRILIDVLHCRRSLHRAKNMLKIMVGGKEVECNPSFKLFLVSTDRVSSVPTTVFFLTSVVVFQPERKGMQGLLLDSFLELQNVKTSHDREQLRRDIHTQAVRLQSVEEKLLQLLANQDGGGQIEDPQANKSILTLNKAYEDAQESLTHALFGYSKMEDVHLVVLKSLASQAGVMMDVVCAMGSLLPAYQTSYKSVESVFLAFIEQAGSRIQGEDALAKMTRAAYNHFVRGYFEKDRLLFSFILAQEIEITSGRGTRREQDFLVCPCTGNQFTVRGLLSAPMCDSRSGQVVNFGKKTFDWMSDAQWQSLLMLASNFPWIHEILEQLGKDGKEAVWRTISEGVAPEMCNLSESIGCKLYPLQQLLVMCAMRPERTMQFIVSFVTSVLSQGLKQKKLNYDAPIEITRMAKVLAADQIPMILFRDDPHIPVTKLGQVAQKLDIDLITYYVHGCGDEEIHSIKQAMELASSQGKWILLHNCHTSPKLLIQLPSLLRQLPPRDNWKLWLSLNGDCRTLPSPLLHSACKVVLDSPHSIRSSVLHSLVSAGSEIVSASSRPEWLPLLHAMAMLHATLRLRKQAYQYAWKNEYIWTHAHLMDTLHYLKREFKSSELVPPGTSGVKPISWSGIRYMLSEVFYGSAVTDVTDHFILTGLTEYWIHAGGPKREAGRYHTPSQFFSPNTKLSTLMNAVENASPPLVFTAELCGLYFNSMIQLGWKSYLFSNLSSLSAYLQQHLKPSPLIANKVADTRQLDRKMSASLISLQSTLTLGAQSTTANNKSTAHHHHQLMPIDRLPSFIQLPTQITEVVLTRIPSCTLRVLGNTPALIHCLHVPLQTTLNKLITNIPTPWKKELLMDRLKRHRVETPFGLFIKSETYQMSVCLQGILDSLQELQGVLEKTCSMDGLTECPYMADLALSLLSLKVPSHWVDLVGPTAPPSSWPLKEWVQDLVLRFTFLDRILIGGLSKTPTYWLGAFFNPQSFLSVVQQNFEKAKSSVTEQLTFRAELTSRDKDHIRDPPPEGELFVYGAYIWGCGYEKTTNLDLQDVPPKLRVPTALPVLHLAIVPQSSASTEQHVQTSSLAGESKGPHVFHCPGFAANSIRMSGSTGAHGGSSKVLFTLTITSSDVTPVKWATRNVCCTLRPF